MTSRKGGSTIRAGASARSSKLKLKKETVRDLEPTSRRDGLVRGGGHKTGKKTGCAPE